MNTLRYQLQHTEAHSQARAGRITTDHGVIETPIFMPVGTVGSVKALTQQHLTELVQAQIILGNTYHLFLRPGTVILQQASGLHRFIGWDRPMLTDSGGYQVYSLAQNRQITEEGVTFANHIDGSKHLFTPESVIDIERQIGADIIMVLDECPPYPCDYAYAQQSMAMTHRWAQRCKDHFTRQPPQYDYGQNLFPIIQGSSYRELRTQSTEFVAGLDLPGHAIGGLSVGEPAEIMYELTDLSCRILPRSQPRYLMGVGTPTNLLECIALGVDMFDCVLPTRNARHGEKIILGADVKNGSIAVSGWQEESGVELHNFLKDYQEKSVQYTICTDVAKDGLLQGPAIDLYREISENLPELKLIASGGVTTVDDLRKLRDIGCFGAIVGKAIYEGNIQVSELQQFA